jgi:hypothetical protein
MLPRVGRRLTRTAVGSGGSNSVVFVLPYDRSPWVAQFGRDNFANRGAYPAPIPIRAPKRRSGARGYRSCPDHCSRLAESLRLRHAGPSRPVARHRRLGTAFTLYDCMEWPSLVDISLPPRIVGEGAERSEAGEGFISGQTDRRNYRIARLRRQAALRRPPAPELPVQLVAAALASPGSRRA